MPTACHGYVQYATFFYQKQRQGYLILTLLSPSTFSFLAGQSVLQITLEEHTGNSFKEILELQMIESTELYFLSQPIIYQCQVPSFASFIMVSQNISQVQGGGLSATTEDMNKEQYSSKGIASAPAASLFSTQSVRETSTAPSSSQNIAGIWQISHMLLCSPSALFQ